MCDKNRITAISHSPLRIPISNSVATKAVLPFDAVLAIAGKIRSGTGPPSNTFYKCLEEAQGIARSSLFGPVVRKEAVQGGMPIHSYGRLFH